ncbi:hypothetical protein Efla_003374 [Eimeria flavescens]
MAWSLVAQICLLSCCSLAAAASLRPPVASITLAFQQQQQPAAAAAAAVRGAMAAAAAATTTEERGPAIRRAALFPGQGAQCLGMGVEAARSHGPSMALFERASAAALPFDVCCGLSLGEFTALCFSGVLEFEDAVALTARRGALMQAAAEETPGCMFAVLGLSKEETERVCANVISSSPGAHCGVANYLCSGNYAVSVSAAAAKQLEAAAAASKARRCVKLQVAGAFHSPLMAAAAEGLAAALETAQFQTPQIPVLLNVDAQIHTDPQIIKQKLLQQLTSPTQWQASMERLVAAGLTEAFEFGPGGVLSGILKKIEPRVKLNKVE